MGAKIRSKSGTKKCNNGGEDRLSSLPDAILISILSLLPLKSTIATGVLSSRWRCLWTQVTSFEVEGRCFSTISDFFRAVDSVLTQITSPVIFKSKFRLHGLLENEQDVNTSRMDSWFRLLCARNVHEIQVTCDSYRDKYSLRTLPPCIFRIQSLIVLEIGTKHDCNILQEFEINLPNLKTLRIDVPRCNCVCMAKLIKSCPVLEDLYIKAAVVSVNEVIALDISGHNLKRLDMFFYRHVGLQKMILDVPNLEVFTVIFLYPLRFEFLENPINLVEASIWVFKNHEHDKTILMRGLFAAISNVQSLVIYEHDHLDFSPTTMFSNLRRLTFAMTSSAQFTELIALLHCCPVLEVLILSSRNGKETSWMPPDSTPACLLTHVKRMEIKILMWKLNKKHWLNLLRYLLSRALVLKRIILTLNIIGIQCKEIKQEELMFCKELYEFPRSSLCCQIEFIGKHLNISGEGKRVRGPNGRLLSFE